MLFRSITLFNGISRAFEIKTEFDSERRLNGQLKDYNKLFQECYIVIPEHLIDKYDSLINNNIGIDILYQEKGTLKINNYRKAIENDIIDHSVLMRSLKTSEYKNIVLNTIGALPNVSCFEMFDACYEIIKDIPYQELHYLFTNEIKKRKNNTSLLNIFPKELRQICLCLNVNIDIYRDLELKLNNKINFNTCTYHI